MIVYFPFVLFAAGLLIAYGSAGVPRQLATIAMVAAGSWSLVLLVDPASATWAIGPIIATLLLPRAGQRVRSSFEGLTRRALNGRTATASFSPPATPASSSTPACT